jgi:hypothetical protein
MPTKKRSKTELSWEDPPGRGHRAHLQDHHGISAKLRANPGIWAHVLTYASSTTSASMAGCIRNGRTSAWKPEGAYESAARTVSGEHRVYARFIPEGQR